MKKCLVMVLVTCVLSLNTIGVTEGLLPQLGEVYGVGMPSIGDVLHTYPDKIETNTDGSTVELFHDVSEEDYQAYGQLLAEEGCEMVGYTVEGTTFIATVQKKNHTFVFEYDTKERMVTVTYPEGSFDERVDAAEKLYIQGQEELQRGDYEAAYDTFTCIVDPNKYKDVEALLNTDELIAAKWAKDFEIGGLVTLGKYEQDNNVENGKEPIEWIVLHTEGNKTLLLSKYALDIKWYHDNDYSNESKNEHNTVTWETSMIKKWLNNDFTNSFSTEEKGAIMKASDDHDAIFLLSRSEAEKYIPEREDRICYATDYVKQKMSEQGAKKLDNPHGWWLRNCFYDGRYYAEIVNSTGTLDHTTVYKDIFWPYWIRPAIWVNTQKAIDANLNIVAEYTVPDSTFEVENKTVYVEQMKGSRGNAVKNIQQKLIDLGYLDGKADGVYGSMTEEAVKKAQTELGLPVTGIADALFQKMLFSE